MLFNSHAFLFGFLPVTLVGYFALGRWSAGAAVAWLAGASLFFYAYWDARFLALMIGSIAFNYALGTAIGREPDGPGKTRKFWFGVAANLALLGLFKYLAPSVAFLAGLGLLPRSLPFDIVLPLGISFFTFTQIGYLVDRRDGVGADLDPIRYTVFVTLFPHLIAGPILHIREIGPQLIDPATVRPRAAAIAPGLTLFVIGLGKKVILADPLGAIIEPAFLDPSQLTVVSTWFTVLGYSLQLYFDFSGYSDMAIGLAAILGFRFPVNFDSPYKARCIIDFWQRWHMTLTRYLGLLLYSPVALWVTRRRVARGLKISSKAAASPGAFLSMIAFPTFVTMGLAGIWHGAGSQFLVFGLLHAVYLTINHAWRVGAKKRGPASNRPAVVAGQVLLTFAAVLLAQVFFRAESSADALHIVLTAFGAGPAGLPPAARGLLGSVLPPSAFASDVLNIVSSETIERIVIGFAIVWLLPNSQQILGRYAPVLEGVRASWPIRIQWRPTFGWAVATAIVFCAGILSFGRSTTFLYFQF